MRRRRSRRRSERRRLPPAPRRLGNSLRRSRARGRRARRDRSRLLRRRLRRRHRSSRPPRQGPTSTRHRRRRRRPRGGPPAAPGPDEPAAKTPPPAPEPPQKQFEELVVSRDSVIGLQTENRISSDTARVEDRVEARVTRDVKVGDRVAIPSGARAIGAVTLVERGGKFKERARLGIRFHTLVLTDGTRIPMNTETIFRAGHP